MNVELLSQVIVKSVLYIVTANVFYEIFPTSEYYAIQPRLVLWPRSPTFHMADSLRFRLRIYVYLL